MLAQLAGASGGLYMRAYKIRRTGEECARIFYNKGSACPEHCNTNEKYTKLLNHMININIVIMTSYFLAKPCIKTSGFVSSYLTKVKCIIFWLVAIWILYEYVALLCSTCIKVGTISSLKILRKTFKITGGSRIEHQEVGLEAVSVFGKRKSSLV